MEHAFQALWWLIALVLVVRWVKGFKPRNTRTGRVYSNRIEWD